MVQSGESSKYKGREVCLGLLARGRSIYSSSNTGIVHRMPSCHHVTLYMAVVALCMMHAAIINT